MCEYKNSGVHASKSTGRNGALDLIKGLCIVLVAFGHLPKQEGVLVEIMYSITDFIYTFHVSFFLILAGFFHAKKVPCYDEFAKVVKRLAIPYLMVGFIFFMCYTAANRLGIPTTGGNISLVKIVSGRAGGALWFVYTLMLLEFVVLIMDAATRKIPCRWLRMTLIVAGTSVMSYVIKSVFCGAVYVYSQWMVYLFFVGYFLKIYYGAIPAFWWGLLPMLPLWLCLKLELWNQFRYVLVPLFLFGFAWFGQKMNECKSCPVSALRFLGSHTMPIMLFHPLFITCFKLPMRRLLHFGMAGGIIYYFAMTVMVVGACLVAEWCLDRIRLSFVMGKSSRNI